MVDISGLGSSPREQRAVAARPGPRRLVRFLGLSLALVLALGLLAGPLAPPARADMAAGWKAYARSDYAGAEAEWRPLAEAGNADALLAMGMLAEARRQGAAALDWYRRAARAGQTAAQVILGARYAEGIDVAVDLVQAYYWFDQAARKNHPRAAQLRDSLLARMTPEERALARQIAE